MCHLNIYKCYCKVWGDFFGKLHRMLSEMDEVIELYPVPDAHVPVMKFKLTGVSIDLLYAKLYLWVIPEVSSFFCPYYFFWFINLSLYKIPLACFRLLGNTLFCWHLVGLRSYLYTVHKTSGKYVKKYYGNDKDALAVVEFVKVLDLTGHWEISL